MKINQISVVVLMLFAGCATTPRVLNRLSVGMDKARVIDIMGDPDSARASETHEVMVYDIATKSCCLDLQRQEHWIVLKDGKVVKFGKPTDPIMTDIATQNLNVKLKQEK
jgi:hypothetical protein